MAQPLLDAALWARLEPLLLKLRRRGGRPRVSERAALTGILFVLRGGLRGRCYRVKWDAAQAARAGDAW